MKHFASARFWACYRALSLGVRELADKSFERLKADPAHPSLHFKKMEKYYSVRVGLHYRALGIEVSDGVLWFWIGTHAEYDKLVS